MEIIPSLDFLGPHSGTYRLPATNLENFKEAINTLSTFMDYYYTPSKKASSLEFTIDISKFTPDQQHLLQPVLKKKNLKIK
jgi:hypothetical protein